VAANTTPIFSKAPRASGVALSVSAVTGTDGTDANVKTVFTADATNGSKIEDVYITHSGTNSADTVVRFYINNGADHTVATNNFLVHEETMLANTLSQAAASVQGYFKANFVMPPGYKLLAASGAAISGGMSVVAFGGDY
jgi:hypothetical protein